MFEDHDVAWKLRTGWAAEPTGVFIHDEVAQAFSLPPQVVADQLIFCVEMGLL